jgi:hypothetical protein
VEAWQEHIASLVDGWIAIRRDLAVQDPRLAADPELTLLREQIENLVNRDFYNRLKRVARFAEGFQWCPEPVVQAIAAGSKLRDYRTLETIRNRIDQLRIESRQGLYLQKENNMKIELNNSTIHQLNLGTVVGDMNNSVTALQETGHAEFAQALKAFTEQVANADEVPTQARKELIQNVALVGEQAALPPEQRKSGLLKAAIGYVKTTTQIAASLSEAWKQFGPAIESFFKHYL